MTIRVWRAEGHSSRQVRHRGAAQDEARAQGVEDMRARNPQGHRVSHPASVGRPNVPSGTSAATLGQHGKPFQTLMVNAAGVARIPLRPTTAQKLKLDALFGGPLELLRLLREHGEPIEGPTQASWFLLQHRRALEGHLSQSSRPQVVDWLKALLVNWSRTAMQEIALSFDAACSVSAAQEVHVPIHHLGGLAPQDRREMADLRHGQRYRPDFQLLCLRDGALYAAEIVFEPAQLPQAPSLPRRGDAVGARSAGLPGGASAPVRPVGRQESTNDRASVSVEQLIALFDSALNRRLMEDMRIARQYSRTVFEKLEGREVLGGLPSLGKHR